MKLEISVERAQILDTWLAITRLSWCDKRRAVMDTLSVINSVLYTFTNKINRPGHKAVYCYIGISKGPRMVRFSIQ